MATDGLRPKQDSPSVVPGRAKSGNHMLLPREYDALLAAQGGRCAICPNTPKTRRLHVDRDHKTGAVRGLLCMRCNRNLPSWVTVEWLTRAALYLAPELEGVTLGSVADVGWTARIKARAVKPWRP